MNPTECSAIGKTPAEVLFGLQRLKELPDEQFLYKDEFAQAAEISLSRMLHQMKLRITRVEGVNKSSAEGMISAQ